MNTVAKAQNFRLDNGAAELLRCKIFLREKHHAYGKARVSYNKGQPVAPGNLIDKEGRPTTDPVPMIERKEGALTAFGAHKGSGLAFMCELLGGSLTGTGATEEGRRFANGMLSFYIDPKKIDHKKS